MVVEEGGEEGREAWKEGDPWPSVQSDSEEDEEAGEEKNKIFTWRLKGSTLTAVHAANEIIATNLF